MLYGWLKSASRRARLSPLLLWVIRWIYLSAGGTTTMGMIGGTIVRLVLATLVLGVPTFLMGGTLPAAVRAIASEDDRGRRRVALLYGINTLGAVLGSALATFFMIEQYGTRATLWIAALLNLALGALVISRAKKQEPQMNADERRSEQSSASEKPEAPTWFVLPAAAIVGFAFFLMEMIWYRMLSPILGGSVFTFGLILCLVLLGIGVGGLLYSMQSAGRRAAAGCDDVPARGGVRWWPIKAIDWRGGMRLQAWSVLIRQAADGRLRIAVLLAAIVAGYQFPADRTVGRASESAGMSERRTPEHGPRDRRLSGRRISARRCWGQGCWQMVGILLGLLGLWAIIVVGQRPGGPGDAPMAMACLVLRALHQARPPRGVTAASAWGEEFQSNTVGQRISRVAAGSAAVGAEGIRRLRAAGIENRDGLAFIVNGKVDGNAVGDCGTMLGVVGAI
jgi:hypothetical protein